MSGQVKFSYNSAYKHKFNGSGGYEPQSLNECDIEITIPHTDLCVGQYTELFKSFLLAIGFDKEQVLRGCLALALSEDNTKEQNDKLMEEFELQDKLPNYLSVKDEELLLQVLNPLTDTDENLEELSEYLRPVVELIREYNKKRSKKVDEIISQVEKDGWIGKEITANTLKNAYKVCTGCGNQYGTYKAGVSSWWVDKCDVCGEETSVTESRDFNYLKKGIDAFQNGGVK